MKTPANIMLLALICVILSVPGWIAWLLVNAHQHREDTLPYSRPHLDWQRAEDGVRCVGWIIIERGHYFVICHREPPMLLPIHEANEMFRERMIYET